MRPGIPLLLTLAVCAGGSAIALYGTPAFPLAAAVAAIAMGAGLLVFRFRHSDPALFLVAQPCLFLSWEGSPYLAFLFEAALASALLFSSGSLKTRNDFAYAALFFVVMGMAAYLLSGRTHVFFPILVFIIVAGLSCLFVLGLAYRTVVRAGGGML